MFSKFQEHVSKVIDSSFFAVLCTAILCTVLTWMLNSYLNDKALERTVKAEVEVSRLRKEISALEKASIKAQMKFRKAENWTLGRYAKHLRLFHLTHSGKRIERAIGLSEICFEKVESIEKRISAFRKLKAYVMLHKLEKRLELQEKREERTRATSKPASLPAP